MSSSWTQGICDPCWSGNYPDRQPVRLVEPVRDNCSVCGMPTMSGIYIRRDPRSVQYPTARKAKQWPLPEVKAPARGPSFDHDLEALVKMGFLVEEARPWLERAYDTDASDPVGYSVRALVSGKR